MNYKENDKIKWFAETVIQQLQKLTDINDRIKLINNYREWLDKIEHVIKADIINYEWCRECHKYYLKENLSTLVYEKDDVHTISTDSGYGDDDHLADVVKQCTIIKCPCNHIIRSDEKIIKFKKDYLRWERRAGLK